MLYTVHFIIFLNIHNLQVVFEQVHIYFLEIISLTSKISHTRKRVKEKRENNYSW